MANTVSSITIWTLLAILLAQGFAGEFSFSANFDRLMWQDNKTYNMFGGCGHLRNTAHGIDNGTVYSATTVNPLWCFNTHTIELNLQTHIYSRGKTCRSHDKYARTKI